MTMPVLLPQPQQIMPATGVFRLPGRNVIGIESHELADAAQLAGEFLPRAETRITVPEMSYALTLSVDPAMRPQSYDLTVTSSGIHITGAAAAAVVYGLHTLEQVVAQAEDGQIPCLTITDWPDYADRGLYYDVCRGRVPTLEQLLRLADTLARYKINQLQLYIEHTFAFQRHPKIGRGASPLSADDILALDEYCDRCGIELVPSLASFGHLQPVLRIPEYRHLAEDFGIGKYAAADMELPPWFKHTAWTLSPARPEIYTFLDSLFAEFLPLFRSKRFNICCDETCDLGYGQSYEMCREKGKGRVYLDHILKVREIAARYGKKIMFWGDIIRHYPEMIPEIPDDVTVLDWGYTHNHPFDRIKDFRQAGVPFYACPGTAGWVSLFPRLPEAMINIAEFAAAGRRHGARGLLTTDWGDGGHYNFMEYSWHGYLFGAEQGWNTSADVGSFTTRFVRLFLNSQHPGLAAAITRFGDISHATGPCYMSLWQPIFFAVPADPILHSAEPLDLGLAENGELRIEKRPLDAEFGRQQLPALREIRRVFVEAGRERNSDPLGVLPYWIFAIDTTLHAARKLSILGPGGADSPAARRRLKKEMQGLMKQFETLWMARNRRSEIRITLKYYQRVLDALGTPGRKKREAKR
jgi:hexosaminidase